MQNVNRKFKIWGALLFLLFFAVGVSMYFTAANIQAATKTGFVTINGDSYYINEDGSKQKGWLELEGKKYVMFRKELAAESAKHAKQERLYRYLVSIAVTSNRKLYKRLCDEKGEFYARIFLYACKNLTAVDNEFIMLEDNE